MQANVGGADRVVRIVVGLALLGYAAFGPEPTRWWGLIGIIPILTGTIRWCPLYTPFGISSCAAKKS